MGHCSLASLQGLDLVADSCFVPHSTNFHGPPSALACVCWNKSLRYLRELLVTRKTKACYFAARARSSSRLTLTPRAASQPVHSHIPTQNGENEQAWVSIQRTVLLTSDECKSCLPSFPRMRCEPIRYVSVPANHVCCSIASRDI